VPDPASPVPPSPDPSAPPVEPPERTGLADLAVLLHRATEGRPDPILFGLGLQDASAKLGIGHWPLPGGGSHPADVLVGYLAPEHWDAIALVGPAEQVLPALDPGPFLRPAGGGAPPVVARPWCSIVLDRQGKAGAVVGLPGEVLVDLEPDRVGWPADALARSFGRPTAPPQDSVVEVAECAWLDLVAAEVLIDPGAIRSWVPLAALHPLARGGRVESPEDLASATRRLATTTSWSRLRGLQPRAARPPKGFPVPAGGRLPPGRWHDDGSFSRYTARTMGPSHEVLAAVLAVLPEVVGRQLVAALVTVAPEAAVTDDPTGTEDLRGRSAGGGGGDRGGSGSSSGSAGG
jgi:hypothetical protein